MLTRLTNLIDKHPGLATPHLRVVHGTLPGREVEVAATGVVVGTESGCELMLADAAVDARHVTIKPVDAGFEVTDLGSRAGTWLDGAAAALEPHKPTLVAFGATLRVGATLLGLVPGEAVVELPASSQASFGGLTGESVAMRKIYALLERAVASDANVLLHGEGGTGKELAARALHEHANRPGPFVILDAGAGEEILPEAVGGTLFVDEVGDLPLALQGKLLRGLERNLRVVAATRRELWAEVAHGAFRGDLYYRLAAVEVLLPPLRHRHEDIPELVRRFLEQAGATAAASAELRGPSLELLLAYAWPGNVRELRQVISRAVALAPATASFAEMPLLLRAAGSAPPLPHYSTAVRAERPFHDVKDEMILRFEREYLADLLARHGDNLSEAARIAGLERKYLYRLLEKVGLRTKHQVPAEDE